MLAIVSSGLRFQCDVFCSCGVDSSISGRIVKRGCFNALPIPFPPRISVVELRPGVDGEIKWHEYVYWLEASSGKLKKLLKCVYWLEIRNNK